MRSSTTRTALNAAPGRLYSVRAEYGTAFPDQNGRGWRAPGGQPRRRHPRAPGDERRRPRPARPEQATRDAQEQPLAAASGADSARLSHAGPCRGIRARPWRARPRAPPRPPTGSWWTSLDRRWWTSGGGRARPCSSGCSRATVTPSSTSTRSKATTSSATRAAWGSPAAPRDLERQGHPRVPVPGGARGDPALAVARPAHGADRHEPARASGLARRDPPVGRLGDGRRADAGRVRDRRRDLRPSRACRGRLRDRRAHGPGPPEAPVARRRGECRRARGLGAPRACTGGALGVEKLHCAMARS